MLLPPPWLLCGLLVAGVAAQGDQQAQPRSMDGLVWGDWWPRTEAHQNFMNGIEAQVQRMESLQERFDAYIFLASAGMLTPNFTRNGYEVVKQPPGVHARLNASLHAGLRGGPEDEPERSIQISGPHPKFVDVEALKTELLQELLPHHEAWAGGIKLTPAVAYGLRVYDRDNWLTMHFDKMESHIISSILHVDRDVDEPWPIAIEGFDGKTVEVDLKPGEMLFYESTKCMHGRPRPLKGRFYASLFMHYHPVGWSLPKQDAIKLMEETGRRWETMLPADSSLPGMRMFGTGFYEPHCPNHWCRLDTSQQHAGTAEL